MKQLRIQSQVLLGWGDNWHRNGNSGPLLSQLLPPNLNDLTIHCCEVEKEYRKEDGAHHFEESLDSEVSTRSFFLSPHFRGRDRRVIENVVVCILRDPIAPYLSNAIDSCSLTLERCFDIVGKN